MVKYKPVPLEIVPPIVPGVVIYICADGAWQAGAGTIVYSTGISECRGSPTRMLEGRREVDGRYVVGFLFRVEGYLNLSVIEGKSYVVVCRVSDSQVRIHRYVRLAMISELIELDQEVPGRTYAEPP